MRNTYQDEFHVIIMFILSYSYDNNIELYKMYVMYLFAFRHKIESLTIFDRYPT